MCPSYKSLYDFKEAHQAWYTLLSDYLLSIGFQVSKVDTLLFILSMTVDMFYILV